MIQADHPIMRPDRGFPVLPFSLITGALILLAALFVGHASLRHMGLVVPSNMAQRGEAPAYEVVVGGINFRVPTGYLRFAEQHRNGLLPSIDLALAWPTMTPLGDAETLRATPRESIVFIGISDAEGSMDTTDLLGSVYREVFVGPIEHTPAGLVRRQLDPQAGYVDERVYYDISTGSGFAARCAGGGETVWETCYRDVILTNGLTVTYRFAPELLDRWQDLDESILGLLLTLARSSQDYQG
ncbi:MAG: hypothetical protein AB8B88_08805 [Devosiaceae bacterium]